MKKMFLMAAFAAFSFAANAQTQATASTTDAVPAPAKKSCCASMANKTECATMSKAECAKAMSEGKCAEKGAKTSMAAKADKASTKKTVAANKP